VSKENVELLRRTLETFNRESVEAALAYLDPEVEWLERHLYKGQAWRCAAAMDQRPARLRRFPGRSAPRW
jgi:hypothetical protein